MPKGSCDHTLDPRGFNVQELAKGNGDVNVDIRWTWDGTSVWPDCDGPVLRVRAVNTGSVSWFVHVPRARGGSRVLEIEAGQTRTWTGAQLATVGLDSLSAVSDLTLTRSATARQR